MRRGDERGARSLPRTARLALVAVWLVVGPTSIAACAETSEGAALDAASDDLDCSESDLHVMSQQVESDGSIVYRIWGCGREAGYVCKVVRRGKSSGWQCTRTLVSSVRRHARSDVA